MDVTGARPAWFLLSQHWLSLLGSALIAAALISSLFVFPPQIRGHTSNFCVGIIVLLVLPVVFFITLILGSDRNLSQQASDSGRVDPD
jgi:membrane associated rhomboid family serine protease